jgi:glycerol-3-phosphate dehydrogenase (NAD(P)+)
MPISSAVAAMLAGQMSVDQAIESLLARPLRSEQ